jgi:hypothetical protein
MIIKLEGIIIIFLWIFMRYLWLLGQPCRKVMKILTWKEFLPELS